MQKLKCLFVQLITLIWFAADVQQCDSRILGMKDSLRIALTKNRKLF
ncbi:hypothetical protein SDC9_182529 [bioreactor metagenome]|uniref:Uncharacterized protein n=1 Tax=bioreactor metagenome TaxID=1076179 RepID=A0A645H7S4_9ZZZZ